MQMEGEITLLGSFNKYLLSSRLSAGPWGSFLQRTWLSDMGKNAQLGEIQPDTGGEGHFSQSLERECPG